LELKTDMYVWQQGRLQRCVYAYKVANTTNIWLHFKYFDPFFTSLKRLPQINLASKKFLMWNDKWVRARLKCKRRMSSSKVMNLCMGEHKNETQTSSKSFIPLSTCREVNSKCYQVCYLQKQQSCWRDNIFPDGWDSSACNRYRVDNCSCARPSRVSSFFLSFFPPPSSQLKRPLGLWARSLSRHLGDSSREGRKKKRKLQGWIERNGTNGVGSRSVGRGRERVSELRASEGACSERTLLFDSGRRTRNVS
jgi:hypothetical protein